MKPARYLLSLVVLLCFIEVLLPAAIAQQTEELRKGFQRVKAKAEKGDADAQGGLGSMYTSGEGVEKDYAEAMKWFRKAADQGHAYAQANIGFMYERGEGVEKDDAEAVKWYRKAADQELAAAQYNLGLMYANGNGVAKDEAEAVKWYRKAADQGDALAQNNLGLMYANGEGVAKDETEAVKWYRKAADQGDATAQSMLGWMYYNGQGVEKDYAEAVKWYRKAAEQKHADGQYRLGLCYDYGNGVQTDMAEAAKWFEKAAVQGHVKAQYDLASAYHIGRGVQKNRPLATVWHRKAAENGYARSQEILAAECYMEPDVQWALKAASQGHAWVQHLLGHMYKDGKGAPQDYVEAHKWFNLAAANGRELAAKSRDTLAMEMTRAELTEARRLAREFKPRTGSNEGAFVPDKDGPAFSPSATGTGFHITEDGYLITNEHVIRNATQIRLVTSAGTISAKVVKVDAANDLALLKAEGKFAALPVASSRGVKLGGTVATVGFPNIGLQGFAPKLAKGEIASLSGAQDDARYFQISVPVQPGNSGGALVDERGNVVGVVSAKLNARAALSTSGALPENVNYAVKSSYLLSFLESVPEVAAKLREPESKERKFEDVVRSAEQAAVLVLVY